MTVSRSANRRPDNSDNKSSDKKEAQGRKTGWQAFRHKICRCKNPRRSPDAAGKNRMTRAADSEFVARNADNGVAPPFIAPEGKKRAARLAERPL